MKRCFCAINRKHINKDVLQTHFINHLKIRAVAMTYEQMTARWGETVAAFLLREIEKAAQVANQSDLPPQERLDRAAADRRQPDTKG